MARKAQARLQRASWRQAIAEGRVVRYDGGLMAVAYRTVADAERCAALARADGRQAELVSRDLAYT